MKKIYLNNGISFDKLADRYADTGNIIDINIGYDDRIYFLIVKPAPEKVNGIVVNMQSAINYSVLVLTFDWTSGEILHKEYTELGQHQRYFDIIRPLEDKFLLVECNTNNDKNAVLVDNTGRPVREFFLGNCIDDCLVMDDGRIITAYSDTGSFSNDPISGCGLNVWDDEGRLLHKNTKYNILHCYAVNTDDRNRIWFYYYNKFQLVRTDLKTDIVFDTEIKYSPGFLISGDSRHIIFMCGREKCGELVSAEIRGSVLADYEETVLVFENDIIRPKIFCFRGSKAVFTDAANNFYISEIEML